MINQTLELKNFKLVLLEYNEIETINGGHWIEYVWKAFQALTTADAIDDAVNGLKDGYNAGYNRGSNGHGASGTW
jgi:hypothetical protein